MECRKLGLQNPLFDSMLTILDASIKGAFTEMADKDIGKASTTLKIDMEINKKEYYYENDGTSREAALPRITFSVTNRMESQGKVKGEISNGVTNEIYRDADGQFYLVPAEEMNGQITWDQATREAETDDDE